MNRVLVTSLRAWVLAISFAWPGSAVLANTNILTISKATTNNVSCSGGVCQPTGPGAVLNVTDLENMLASGNVSVTSAEPPWDIDITAALTWTSANTLALKGYHIAIAKPLTVAGPGGLELETVYSGNGALLAFPGKGSISFWNLSSKLTIQGNPYTLVGDIATLASDIANVPKWYYALASNIRAKGTYASTPIPTPFKGVFEGLGHTISNLSIDSADAQVGLFAMVDAAGMLRDVGIVNANVVSENTSFSTVGTLVGQNQGKIIQSYATGAVHGDFRIMAGGLAGENDKLLSRSYAAVIVSGGDTSLLGGLVGNVYGRSGIVDCYATGAVSGGAAAYVGGLLSYNLSAASDSYATGVVAGGAGSFVGGFAGADSQGRISNGYWDTTTSGASQGVGDGNESGVTGLTTAQLQAGLPAGFRKSVWGQDAKINNGLPYLLALPPG